MGVLKLTKWYPGDVKPAHIGVYQTSHDGNYQFWNGEFWGRCSENPKHAALKGSDRSYFQGEIWRGLAEKP